MGVIIIGVVLFIIFCFPFVRDLVQITFYATVAKEVWENDALFARYAKSTLIRNKNVGVMRNILLNENLGFRRFEFLDPFLKSKPGVRSLDNIEKEGIGMSMQERLLTLIELHKQGNQVALVEEAIQKFLLDSNLQDFTYTFAEDMTLYAYLGKIEGKQVKLLKEKSLEKRKKNKLTVRKDRKFRMATRLFGFHNYYSRCSEHKGIIDFILAGNHNQTLTRIASLELSSNKLVFDPEELDICIELCSDMLTLDPVIQNNVSTMIARLFMHAATLPAIDSVSSYLKVINRFCAKHFEEAFMCSVVTRIETFVNITGLEKKFVITLSCLRVSVKV